MKWGGLVHRQRPGRPGCAPRPPPPPGSSPSSAACSTASTPPPAPTTAPSTATSPRSPGPTCSPPPPARSPQGNPIDHDITTDGAFSDLMMRYARQQLGARAVLENHSIRSTLDQGPAYDHLYQTIQQQPLTHPGHPAGHAAPTGAAWPRHSNPATPLRSPSPRRRGRRPGSRRGPPRCWSRRRPRTSDG